MFVTVYGGDPAENDPKKPLPAADEAEEVDDPEGDENFDEEDELEDGFDDEDEDLDDEDSELDVEDESEEDDEPEEDDASEKEEETEEAEEDSDEEDEGESEETDNGGASESDALKAQIRATLKALGLEEEDTVEGLQRIAAEAQGISLEEYQKGAKEQSELQAAKDLIRRAKEEKMMADDLAAIQKAFPFAREYKSMRDLPHIREFAKLLGDTDGKITVVDAFAATHVDLIMKKTAEASKRTSLDGTKNHLKSSAPKKAKDGGGAMKKSELAQWREDFPNLTDKEIIELYKQSM